LSNSVKRLETETEIKNKLSKLNKLSKSNNKTSSLTSRAHYALLLNLSIRERERENKNQVYANSMLIIGLRSVARSLEITEHLDMNAFVEVHFRYGD